MIQAFVKLGLKLDTKDTVSLTLLDDKLTCSSLIIEQMIKHAFLQAITSINIDLIQLFLEQGIDPNTRDSVRIPSSSCLLHIHVLKFNIEW